MGARSKFAPELTARLVEILREGNYVETACAIVGIHKDTYYEWRKRGEAGEAGYVEFLDQITRASAEAERAALAVIRSAVNNWQSSSWFLERRFPAKFALREPDYDLKTKKLRVELKRACVEVQTLKEKLKLLQAGKNPDGETITVIIPDSLKRDSE